MDKESLVGDGETERKCESSEHTGEIKRVKRRKLGADKEMMLAFLSSVEFKPSTLRSRKEMPPMETETRGSKKTHLKNNALNEIDFKMVDLGDEYGPNIIGRRVEVYWPDSRRWFRGRIKAFDHQKMIHKIDYDDGDKERLDLKNEVFRMEVYPGETVNIKPESNIKQTPKLPVAKDAHKDNKAKKDNHNILLGLQEREGNTSSHGQSFPQVEIPTAAALNSSCPPTDGGRDSESCPGLENKKAEVGEESNVSQPMSDIITTNEGKLVAEDRNLPVEQHFEHRVGKKQLLPSSGNKELRLNQLSCTNYYVRRKRPTTSNTFKV